MDLLKQFISFVEKEKLFQRKDRLLLAVSGGVDSVVLCELCQLAGYAFEIAHCNFKLRGEESERDELFVKGLGNKYGVRVLLRAFDTEKYALLHRISIQVAARELRYDWFRELVGEKISESEREERNAGHEAETIMARTARGEFQKGGSGVRTCDYILTAHHLDDNIETVIMNFFKGTGIAGLRGMLAKTGKLVRPLLPARKEELLAFARERNLLFVEDSSNLTDKYSRNYFRRQVIPLIQKIYPEAEQNIARNIERFRDVESLYIQAVELHKKKLLEYRGGEVFIPILKLQKLEARRTILYEIIRQFGFSPGQVDEVWKLSESETGRFVNSPTYRLLRNRNWFIISKHEPQDNSIIVIHETQRKIPFREGTIHLEELNAQGLELDTGNDTALLDASRIHFPLLLRKWQKGDYFYPLGMNKKKKLSRFFIDQKLPLTEKEKTWVIEMDKKIIWVVGRRIDDRFKLTDRTKSVLKLRWLKN